MYWRGIEDEGYLEANDRRIRKPGGRRGEYRAVIRNKITTRTKSTVAMDSLQSINPNYAHRSGLRARRTVSQCGNRHWPDQSVRAADDVLTDSRRHVIATLSRARFPDQSVGPDGVGAGCVTVPARYTGRRKQFSQQQTTPLHRGTVLDIAAKNTLSS